MDCRIVGFSSMRQRPVVVGIRSIINAIAPKANNSFAEGINR